MLEHTLLQMFWYVIFDDERAFNNALGPSMSAWDSRQSHPLVRDAYHTSITMTMAVVLCLLHGIDLVSHGLNILCFIWWDLLHALILPTDVFPIGHGDLVFAFV